MWERGSDQLSGDPSSPPVAARWLVQLWGKGKVTQHAQTLSSFLPFKIGLVR